MAARRNKAGPGARAAAKHAPKRAPKRVKASLRTKLARARLVCLDVDGVMTDGRIVYGPRGRDQELQFFHVQDGIAIEWLLQHGLAVVWISGRGSRTFLDYCEQECRAILGKHWPAVEAIAVALLDRGSLDGDQLRAVWLASQRMGGSDAKVFDQQQIERVGV